MAKVQLAKVHQYITGHDVLVGKAFMTAEGKYSFGVHTITVGKVVTVPAHLEPPFKHAASQQYRLPRDHRDNYSY